MKIIYLLPLILLGCKSKDDTCKIEGSSKLNLYPVNAALTIPSFEITDSMKYSIESLLSYRIKAADSSWIGFAWIKSYDKNPEALPPFENRFESEKRSIANFSDSLELQVDSIFVVNGTKVGFFRFLDPRPAKMKYESRIIFYKGNILTSVSFYEDAQRGGHQVESITDCILKSLIIK